MTFQKSAAGPRTKRILWTKFMILDMHLPFPTTHIEILRHLGELGYDPCLVAVRSKKIFNPKNVDVPILAIPLRYLPLVSNAMFVLLLFIILPFVVLSSKLDFVVVDPIDATAISLISTRLLPRPIRPKIVLDIRSTPVEVLGLRRRYNELIFDTSVRIARRLFDGITIITPSMKKEICDRLHVDPKFVGVWTSGVSTTLFDPEKYVMSGRALKRRLGLSDRFVVIYHGSLGLKRGVLETVDSITELGSKYRNVLLFVLGSGPALPDLRKLVQDRKIEDMVLVHDPVDYEDVPKYISMSDIGIVPLPDIPDWRNQSPLKLLEYFAMRKVVIVTDINAHREILGDSKCGIYVSSADTKQIAEAIEYAYDNKGNLEDWGAGGRGIIEEKYDWKKVAKDFDSYLMSMCEPKFNRSA